ncbi:MAG: 50S ribosomal protein L19 [Lentisphaerae bacterium RIFOXYB12_FULL_65_16]|nr:MAG: 50S ribosomal protein L19 [Lentisphaerae bacterium RIFOXYA12_64_32]OGV92935.1 MAG: 50S ribosomal protein L19 [Lentisphaerae bacterium RIFOXYB12_FULL_65_16]
MNKIEKIRRENLKTDLPVFAVGDTLKLDVLIVEGDKERSQAFTGTVIARNGRGITESVTLRRISYGQGVERVFPLHSPRLAKITVMKQGKVRRSKLYYLRGQVGKAARIKDLHTS